jgi:hypothetical protein
MAGSRDDLTNALMLLRGESRLNGAAWKTVVPSAATSPTDVECSTAAARTLRRIVEDFLTAPAPAETLDYRLVAAAFLTELADAFDPTSKSRRRAYVQNRSKSRADPVHDITVAMLVHGLRNKKGRQKAIDDVAELIGRDRRQVEKIYDRVQKEIWKKVRASSQ